MFLTIAKSFPMKIGRKLGNLFIAEIFFICKKITKVAEKIVIGRQFRNFPISKFKNS